MPTQSNIGPASEVYRAIVEYDHEPTENVLDPVTRRYERRVTGPVEVRERMIGPYQSIAPMRAYVTRHRNNTNNMRLRCIERVAQWEEVV